MKRHPIYRDYIVTYEQTEFGQLSFPELTIRATNAREAAGEARRAGYRPIFDVRRVEPMKGTPR